MQFLPHVAGMTDRVTYGRKAANLAMLLGAGIRVPVGWILDTVAVRLLLSPSGLTKPNGNVPLEAAADAYEVLSHPPGSALYRGLNEAVLRLVETQRGVRWIVRSSHAFEDGEVASFAGLMRTEINLLYGGDLVRSVVRCAQHVYSERVVAYCRLHGIRELPSAAILVQPLIASRAAGVLIADESRCVIHGNWGLCASVTDGLCTPDEWVVAGNGAAVEYHVGQKEVALVPDCSRTRDPANPVAACRGIPGEPEGHVVRESTRSGVLVVELPATWRCRACLEDESVRSLAELARRIGSILGLARLDLEWCVDGSGEIVVLQGRPAARLETKAVGSRTGTKIAGLPIVGGTAEGEAAVVTGEADAASLSPGGILVARELSGAVLRAMNGAVGCILPTRSILSHSAIIARENGIPTVGGVDAGQIDPGTRYRIDGTTGEVEATGQGTPDGLRRKSSQRERTRFAGPDMLWDGNRVSLFFESSIQWFRECYLRGIGRLPWVFFGDAPFTHCRVLTDRIEIDSYLWTGFFSKLTRAFREDHTARMTLTVLMESRLREYEDTVREAEREWSAAEPLRSERMERQLSSFSHVSAYSFLNHSLPTDWYKDMLAAISAPGNPLAFDDFLVCGVVPHRAQLRSRMLELAIVRKQSGALPLERVEQYRTESAPYRYFAEWCIDDAYLSNPRLILREIEAIAAKHSVDDLVQELELMESRRLQSLARQQGSFEKVARAAEKSLGASGAEAFCDSLRLLSTVATQEEVRHKLQARHLVVLGRMVRRLEIDPARSSWDDILFSAEGRWGR